MKYFYLRVLIASISFMCASSIAYSQQGDNWYFFMDKSKVALNGYDAVAYHTQNEALKGDPTIKSEHKKVTYYFRSAENKRQFDSGPEKYLPAFGGWCTFFMGIDKEASRFPPTRMIPDPTSFKIIDGKLHLFRKTPQQDFKAIFESGDSEAILTRAKEFWQTRVAYSKKTMGLPEGLNPMARMENLDWLPFMGKWEAKVGWWADTTGINVSNFNGEWEFNYGYYGFCIMDDFKGVPGQPFAGTQNGPAIRGYDVLNKEWHMTYIPVNQPRAATWLMTGKFKGPGHLEGILETKDPYGNDILQRVVFKLVDENFFKWRADWSWDNGKTWKEGVGTAECKRIE